MHAEAFAYIAAHLPADAARVLEFGSRNINGSVRVLLAGVDYVGVDIAEGPGADIVADAATVTVPGEPFDVVVCAEVFEHATDDDCAAMCANAWRHLRPGGTFIATMAGHGRHPHSQHDGGLPRPGEFYRNVSALDLDIWLFDAGFDEPKIDVLGTDLRCVAVK
jgi:SAM-dependent methyltransferase